MKLLGFLDSQAIVTELESSAKEAAIHELVEAALSTGAFDAADKDKIIAQVLEREARGSTGLGGGVALPHVKGTEHVKELCGAFARSTRGLEYNAVDGAPVHVLFLILSPPGAIDSHIDILKKISEVSKNEHYLSSFRRAKDQEAMGLLIGGLRGAT